MSKKGLFITLAFTVVVTLGLSIYTLIAVFGAKKPSVPTNINVTGVYRTNDEIVELSKFVDNAITFTYEGDNNPIVYENGNYIATNAGKVTVVVKLDNIGNTKTFDIEVVEQKFDKDGDPKDHIAITSREHLIEYANMTRETKADSTNIRGYEVKLYNDIDLSGIEWIPIGTADKPFYGTFDGQGYTIKGLSIQVTANNVINYMSSVGNNATFYVGLFGCVDGYSTQDGYTVTAELKNVNFDNATIKIDSGVKAAIEQELVKNGNSRILTQSGIGILAGGINKGIVDGGAEMSKLENCVIDGYAVMVDNTEAAVGGLVGIALHQSIISGFDINVTINNDYPAAVRSDIDGNVGKGNYIAGIVGLVQTSTTISNCEVNIVATIKSDNRTMFGGAVATLKNSTLQNVNVVADVRTNDGETSNEINYSRIGGAVFHVAGTTPIVKNVTVNFVSNVHARTSAFVYQNEGTITDSVVKNAYIKSYYANGFAHFNDGTITYTSAFEGEAVKSATLRGFVNSGFVYDNNGDIVGNEFTVVNVTINSRNALYTTTESKYTYENTVGAAGFANISTGKISNFEVNVVINNDVNQVGLVFTLGTYGATSQAELTNMKVNAKLNSALVKRDGKEISTTKYMSGAVARMFNAKMDNIAVVVNANENAVVEKEYGVEFFGGLVARILEDGATIVNSSVTGYAYFNHSNYTVAFTGEPGNKYQVSLVGGLIGAISNDGLSATNGQYTADLVDQHKNIENGSSISITGNTIEGLTLVVNLGNKDIVVAGNKTANRWRIRALGATIGCVYTEDEIALTGNTLKDVVIKTVARDYNYTTNASDNNSTLSDSNRTYGSSFVAITADADPSGVKYQEL